MYICPCKGTSLNFKEGRRGDREEFWDSCGSPPPSYPNPHILHFLLKIKFAKSILFKRKIYKQANQPCQKAAVFFLEIDTNQNKVKGKKAVSVFACAPWQTTMMVTSVSQLRGWGKSGDPCFCLALLGSLYLHAAPGPFPLPPGFPFSSALLELGSWW